MDKGSQNNLTKTVSTSRTNLAADKKAAGSMGNLAKPTEADLMPAVTQQVQYENTYQLKPERK
jgi:hypothetical protein